MAVLKAIREASDFLKQSDKICLLCHEFPDGDTLGGAFALFYALTLMGKQCCVRCCSEFPEKYKLLYPAKMDDFEPEHYVTVDVSGANLLGEYQGCMPVSLCIDHHQMNDIVAARKCVNPEAAAVCEVIYFIIKSMHVEFNNTVANCLYTGVCTDTGCFKFSNTSSLTHKIAAELIDYGADYERINFELCEQKSKKRVLLEKLIWENIEFYFEGRCAIVFISKGEVDSVGEAVFDGASALAKCIEGVEIGLTAREVDFNTYKVSVRTGARVDAAKFCRLFDGGGHSRAAGFKVAGEASAVKREILEAVERAVFW